MPGLLLWVGLLVYLAGVAWLVYLAWSNDEVFMAIGIFFFAPIVGLVYAISHWDEAKIPYGILVVGFLMRVGGVVLDR